MMMIEDARYKSFSDFLSNISVDELLVALKKMGHTGVNHSVWKTNLLKSNQSLETIEHLWKVFKKPSAKVISVLEVQATVLWIHNISTSSTTLEHQVLTLILSTFVSALSHDQSVLLLYSLFSGLSAIICNDNDATTSIISTIDVEAFVDSMYVENDLLFESNVDASIIASWLSNSNTTTTTDSGFLRSLVLSSNTINHSTSSTTKSIFHQVMRNQYLKNEFFKTFNDTSVSSTSSGDSISISLQHVCGFRTSDRRSNVLFGNKTIVFSVKSVVTVMNLKDQTQDFYHGHHHHVSSITTCDKIIASSEEGRCEILSIHLYKSTCGGDNIQVIPIVLDNCMSYGTTKYLTFSQDQHYLAVCVTEHDLFTGSIVQKVLLYKKSKNAYEDFDLVVFNNPSIVVSSINFSVEGSTTTGLWITTFDRVLYFKILNKSLHHHLDFKTSAAITISSAVYQGIYLITGHVDGTISRFYQSSFVSNVIVPMSNSSNFLSSITCILSTEKTLIIGTDNGIVVEYREEDNDGGALSSIETPRNVFDLSKWYDRSCRIQSIGILSDTDDLLVVTRAGTILSLRSQSVLLHTHSGGTVKTSVAVIAHHEDHHPSDSEEEADEEDEDEDNHEADDTETDFTAATVSDKKLFLWRNSISDFDVLSLPVSCRAVAFMPDDKDSVIAVGSTNGTIFIYQDFHIIHEFQDTTHSVEALSYSPNRKLLVVGTTEDDLVFVYEALNGYILYGQYNPGFVPTSFGFINEDIISNYNESSSTSSSLYNWSISSKSITVVKTSHENVDFFKKIQNAVHTAMLERNVIVKPINGTNIIVTIDPVDGTIMFFNFEEIETNEQGQSSYHLLSQRENKNLILESSDRQTRDRPPEFTRREMRYGNIEHCHTLLINIEEVAVCFTLDGHYIVVFAMKGDSLISYGIFDQHYDYKVCAMAFSSSITSPTTLVASADTGNRIVIWDIKYPSLGAVVSIYYADDTTLTSVYAMEFHHSTLYCLGITLTRRSTTIVKFDIAQPKLIKQSEVIAQVPSDSTAFCLVGDNQIAVAHGVESAGSCLVSLYDIDQNVIKRFKGFGSSVSLMKCVVKSHRQCVVTAFVTEENTNCVKVIDIESSSTSSITTEGHLKSLDSKGLCYAIDTTGSSLQNDYHQLEQVLESPLTYIALEKPTDDDDMTLNLYYNKNSGGGSTTLFTDKSAYEFIDSNPTVNEFLCIKSSNRELCIMECSSTGQLVKATSSRKITVPILNVEIAKFNPSGSEMLVVLRTTKVIMLVRTLNFSIKKRGKLLPESTKEDENCFAVCFSAKADFIAILFESSVGIYDGVSLELLGICDKSHSMNNNSTFTIGFTSCSRFIKLYENGFSGEMIVYNISYFDTARADELQSTKMDRLDFYYQTYRKELSPSFVVKSVVMNPGIVQYAAMIATTTQETTTYLMIYDIDRSNRQFAIDGVPKVFLVSKRASKVMWTADGHWVFLISDQNHVIESFELRSSFEEIRLREDEEEQEEQDLFLQSAMATIASSNVTPVTPMKDSVLSLEYVVGFDTILLLSNNSSNSSTFSYTIYSAGRVIVLYNVDNGSLSYYQNHRAKVACIVMMPHKSTTVVSADESGVFYIWDTDTLRTLRTFLCGRKTTIMRMQVEAIDSIYWCTQSSDSVLSVCHYNGSKVVNVISVYAASCTNMMVLPSGNTMCISTLQALHFFNINAAGGTAVVGTSCTDSIYAVEQSEFTCVIQIGNYIVTGQRNGRISLYDSKCISYIKGDDGIAALNSFSDDTTMNNMIISITYSGTISFINADEHGVLSSSSTMNTSLAYNSVPNSISYNAQRVVVSYENGAILSQKDKSIKFITNGVENATMPCVTAMDTHPTRYNVFLTGHADGRLVEWEIIKDDGGIRPTGSFTDISIEGIRIDCVKYYDVKDSTHLFNQEVSLVVAIERTLYVIRKRNLLPSTKYTVAYSFKSSLSSNKTIRIQRLEFTLDGSVLCVLSRSNDKSFIEVFVIIDDESGAVLDGVITIEDQTCIQEIDLSDCGRFLKGRDDRMEISYYDTKIFVRLRSTQCQNLKWISTNTATTITNSNVKTLAMDVLDGIAAVLTDDGVLSVISTDNRMVAQAPMLLVSSEISRDNNAAVVVVVKFLTECRILVTSSNLSSFAIYYCYRNTSELRIIQSLPPRDDITTISDDNSSCELKAVWGDAVQGSGKAMILLGSSVEVLTVVRNYFQLKEEGDDESCRYFTGHHDASFITTFEVDQLRRRYVISADTLGIVLIWDSVTLNVLKQIKVSSSSSTGSLCITCTKALVVEQLEDDKTMYMTLYKDYEVEGENSIKAGLELTSTVISAFIISDSTIIIIASRDSLIKFITDDSTGSVSHVKLPCNTISTCNVNDTNIYTGHLDNSSSTIKVWSFELECLYSISTNNNSNGLGSISSIILTGQFLFGVHSDCEVFKVDLETRECTTTSGGDEKIVSIDGSDTALVGNVSIMLVVGSLHSTYHTIIVPEGNQLVSKRLWIKHNAVHHPFDPCFITYGDSDDLSLWSGRDIHGRQKPWKVVTVPTSRYFKMTRVTFSSDGSVLAVLYARTSKDSTDGGEHNPYSIYLLSYPSLKELYSARIIPLHTSNTSIETSNVLTHEHHVLNFQLMVVVNAEDDESASSCLHTVLDIVGGKEREFFCFVIEQRPPTPMRYETTTATSTALVPHSRRCCSIIVVSTENSPSHHPVDFSTDGVVLRLQSDAKKTTLYDFLTGEEHIIDGKSDEKKNWVSTYSDPSVNYKTRLKNVVASVVDHKVYLWNSVGEKQRNAMHGIGNNVTSVILKEEDEICYLYANHVTLLHEGDTKHRFYYCSKWELSQHISNNLSIS